LSENTNSHNKRSENDILRTLQIIIEKQKSQKIEEKDFIESLGYYNKIYTIMNIEKKKQRYITIIWDNNRKWKRN